MINRKFLYFNTLAGFEAALLDRGTDTTGIRQDSIVFIGQEKLIWNRGIFYGKEEHKDEKSKGLFNSEEQLLLTVPSPNKGDWAFVKVNDAYYIYLCELPGRWVNSGNEYLMGVSQDSIDMMFRDYAAELLRTKEELQRGITTVDGKYLSEIDRIDGILSALPSEYITPDNIGNYIQELLLIPEGVITQDNIGDYIPENVVTADNINSYLPDDILTRQDIDNTISDSTNPVLNVAIYQALQTKADKSQLSQYASTQDVQTLQQLIQTKASNSDFEDYLSAITQISTDLRGKADTTYVDDNFAKKDEIVQQVVTEVSNYVTEITETAEHSKGYFASVSELNQAVPNPEVGDWAIVSVDGQWLIYKCNASGEWESTGQELEFDIDLNGYATKSDLEPLATKEQITTLASQLSNKEDKTAALAHADYAELTYAKKGDVVQQITQVIQAKEHAKGYFDTEAELLLEVPNPESGDWAIVSVDGQWIVYRCNNNGQWQSTGQEFEFDIDLTLYAKKAELADLLLKTEFALYKANLSEELGDINDDITALQILLQGIDTTSGLSAHEQYAEATYAKKTDVLQLVNLYVTEITQVAEKAKGYFDSEQELNSVVSTPEVGDWAIVNVNGQWIIFRCATAGTWVSTGQEYTLEEIDLSQYAKRTELSALATKEELLQHITAADGKYLTTSDLAGYVKTEDLPETVTGVTAADLLPYAKKSEVTAHSDYAELTYAKKTDLSNVVRNDDLDDYATKTYVDSAASALDNKINAISKVGNTNEDLTDFLTSLQNRIQYLYDKYVSWYLGNEQEPGSTDVPDTPSNPDTPVVYNNNMVTLTETEYQRLVENGEVDPDTYYFTYIGEEPSTNWHFGDAFPIILTEHWTFGGTFPINLT